MYVLQFYCSLLTLLEGTDLPSIEFEGYQAWGRLLGMYFSLRVD